MIKVRSARSNDPGEDKLWVAHCDCACASPGLSKANRFVQLAWCADTSRVGYNRNTQAPSRFFP
ncbi:hypothetical protein M413DRAFT_122266 [Hebeloma cylindrosporum]|uniref:Uncharacterized protein n=1 Tax=Hebeloma cylindrosporum TaxID=76867 RepID=A0A0C2YNW7_HEBCY|nr:hypothetical protein M413DRAFT_122266 [Hebeloma cylindrosporum h7]